MVTSPSHSKHFAEYTRRLIQLHTLIGNGEGDSDAADELRDTMDEFWRLLSSQETDRMRLLSADLYTLGRELPAAMGQATDDSVLRSIYSAITSENRDEFATLIRKNLDVLLPGEAALFRGLFWNELGCFDAALPFLKECVRHFEKEVVLEYYFFCNFIYLNTIKEFYFWFVYFNIWGFVPECKVLELEQRGQYAKDYLKDVLSLRNAVLNLEKLARDLEHEIQRWNLDDNLVQYPHKLSDAIKEVVISFQFCLSSRAARLVS